MSKPCMHWLSGMTSNSDNCPYCRIAELEAERDEWKAEYFRRHKDAGDYMTQLLVAQAEVKRLRIAIAVFGRHYPDCAWQSLKPCNCGFEKIFATPSDTAAIDALQRDAERWNTVETLWSQSGEPLELGTDDDGLALVVFDGAECAGSLWRGKDLEEAIDNAGAAIGASND